MRQALTRSAARSPTFVFKVPRGEASFTVLVASFPVSTVDKPTTCLFSLAEEYRASAHNCSPVMAVNFWNDLAASKGLVLARATVMPGVALARCVLALPHEARRIRPDCSRCCVRVRSADARRLLGLLLRYYASDTAAGQAGFEVDAGVDYEYVRVFNEQPHMFDLEGYLRLHNSPTASTTS